MFNRLRQSFGLSPPKPSAGSSTTYDWDSAGTGQTLSGETPPPSSVDSAPPPPSGGFAFRKVLTEEERAALKAKEEAEQRAREEQIRRQLEATQRKLEEEAHAKGQFAKKEKVREGSGGELRFH